MKIKNPIIKDFYKRQKFLQKENLTTIVKLIINNNILPIKLKNKININLNEYSNFSTKFKNICIFSNRTRGNITQYKLNRTQFKNLINETKLSGLKNSSW